MIKSTVVRLAGVALLLGIGGEAAAQAVPAATGAQAYTVFLRSRPVGQESVSVARVADGWLIKGSNQLGPPLDVVTRTAEIHYDREWRPTRLHLEGTSRGQEISLRTAFADGQAASEITTGGATTKKSDAVASDTVVLPNAFLGSYAALALRLRSAKAGAALRAYIAPQGELPLQVAGVFAERIETPRQQIAATRYSLILSNPAAGGDIPMSVWTDADGALLRMSIPAQSLDIAREDVASAATRTTSFALPNDESVRIPASGFSLAATVIKPQEAKQRLPAVVLVGGPDSADRDGFVAGVPVLGQMAADLADAGFFVVRYDRRGAGQSGGRSETATINDYAEDVRAIVRWLDRDRKDVDKERIGLVGYGEGAWIAMTAAAREGRVAAVALVGAGSTTGGELVLEQQQRLLDQSNAPDAEKQAKIELQRRINDAAITGKGWDDVPPALRSAADTPWFQSMLTFDPARLMKDIRQPVLVVHGTLDTEVPPAHADRLAELARARKRKVPTDLLKIPDVNHLLVPARTGARSEYATLPDRRLAPAATAGIAAWMARQMG